MTIAGNQGQNVYPFPDNYPTTSFPQPVPAPDVDPDDAGTLITVEYSYLWQPVLMGAVDQLLNPATWQGNHDEIILALDRAIELKHLLSSDAAEMPTPFWDDETDVEDEAPAETQMWYGGVTDPTAPAGSLDFVESVALWVATGFVLIATFEVGGLAPAIVFHTTVEKFIILQKRGDVAETIRFVIDGEDAKFVSNAPYAPGDIVETTLLTPQTGGSHELMIVTQP